MTDAARYLPLIALSVPLVGAVLLALWPAGAPYQRARRPLAAACLVVSLVALIVGGLGRTTVTQVSFWGAPFVVGRYLAFSLDHLSLWFCLLLVSSLIAVSALQDGLPSGSEGAVAILFVAGTGVAVLVSANMVTLCLAWVLLDGGLLWIDARRASRSSTVYAVRNLVLRTLATIALLAATVLVLADQGDVPIPLAVAKGPSRYMLMTAALLRLGLYPLPGGLQRTWLAYLVAVCAGGYLWLRLATLSTSALPAGSWLVPATGIVLAATALLAATGGSDAPLSAYVISHWLALLVLAPLIDVQGGVAVGLAILLNAALAMVPLAAVERLEARPERWWRLPAAAQLVSLGGGPLTVGFLARWEFLRSAWSLGYPGLFIISVVSFALVSVPVWRQLRILRAWPAPADAESGEQGTRFAWLRALAGSYLPAVVLIAAGTVPWLLRNTQSRLIGRVSLPLAEGLAAVSWNGAPIYAAVAALLALAAAYLVARRRAPAGTPSPGLTTTRTFLELDWLYASAERSLAWVESVIGRAVALLEHGSVSLGWVLLWILAATLFLTGR